MLLAWMLSLALAQDGCEVADETAQSFKPKKSSLQWDAPGKGNRKLLKTAPMDVVEAVKANKSSWKRYPRDVQEALVAGRITGDLDEAALDIAWGAPEWTWKLADKGCRALLYSGGRTDTLVTTCDGAITDRFTLEAPVECERLDVVVPRIDKKARWFRDLELEQQTHVVAGVPRPWMDVDALEVTFGDVYKRKSTDETLVFHDDTGYYRGPTIQMVDGLASSWTFPEADTLTRKGKRRQRRDRRKEEQSERRDQLAAARAEQRKAILSAALAVAVAVAVDEIHQQQTVSSGAGGGSGSSGYRPATTTTEDLGNGGSRTTTQSSQDGIDTTHTQTHVPPPLDDVDGSWDFQSVMCGGSMMQTLGTLTIRGDSYSVKGTKQIVVASDHEPQSYSTSGAVVREGKDIVLEGFARGTTAVTGMQLFLTVDTPAFECAGKQVIVTR